MAGYFCNKRFFVGLLFLALAAVITVHGRHGTRVGFYSRTCPRAESIVRATVESHFRVNPSVAAGLLRMHFHDCFVRGCDASILVSGPNTEGTSPPNLNLNGFEVVDDAKEQLEGACPGVVSCADILALAARDSVVLSGGRSWKVPTGRRDGRVSKNSEPPLNLPSPNDTILVQKKKFARKGLKLKDLVTLTGGHTIGTAACQSFSDRFATNYSDPSINPSFLPQLRKLCPHKAPRKRVALDTGSQFKFDTSYFANMREGRGILRSDQALWTHASTRKYAKKYLASPVRFNVKFGKSMVKMSKIGVKTGTKGEIRRQCHAIN